jgi:hypothetical protein
MDHEVLKELVARKVGFARERPFARQLDHLQKTAILSEVKNTRAARKTGER